jgi:hypothetical protein
MTDASGCQWTFVDKAPIWRRSSAQKSCQPRAPTASESPYAIRWSWTVRSSIRNVDDDPNLVRISTAQPSGIEATGDQTEFVVRRDQLVDRLRRVATNCSTDVMVTRRRSRHPAPGPPCLARLRQAAAAVLRAVRNARLPVSVSSGWVLLPPSIAASPSPLSFDLERRRVRSALLEDTELAPNTLVIPDGRGRYALVILCAGQATLTREGTAAARTGRNPRAQVHVCPPGGRSTEAHVRHDDADCPARA